MLAIFGTVIIFIIWLPVKLIKWAAPDFLPYQVFAISDEPLNHVSLELVTLQGIFWMLIIYFIVILSTIVRIKIYSIFTNITWTNSYQNCSENIDSALGWSHRICFGSSRLFTWRKNLAQFWWSYWWARCWRSRIFETSAARWARKSGTW